MQLDSNVFIRVGPNSSCLGFGVVLATEGDDLCMRCCLQDGMWPFPVNGPSFNANDRERETSNSRRFSKLLISPTLLMLELLRAAVVALHVPTGVLAFPAILVARSFSGESGSIAQEIRNTWVNPADTLTVLLIIGGDVVAKALAQLVGPLVVPVAFSFGWVAYSFSTLMSVFGNGRLMPEPDYDAKLANISSGIWRDNRSWVLARFLRDNEQSLLPTTALHVAIYHVTGGLTANAYDWCYISGFIVIIAQLGIAAIPCGLDGDWSILLITAAGTALALITGTLPQWRMEKFSGRFPSNTGKPRPKVVALTRGNGSGNVIVIVDAGTGIDLEDLAASQPPTLRRGRTAEGRLLFGLPRSLRITQIASLALAVGWIVLLLTVTGVKTHPWYLLLVGGIGMLQNIVVAGVRRSPRHIMERVENFSNKKVMAVLQATEEAYPRVGQVLLAEFFSTEKLRTEEKEWWDTAASGSRSPANSSDVRIQAVRNRSREILHVGHSR